MILHALLIKLKIMNLARHRLKHSKKKLKEQISVLLQEFAVTAIPVFLVPLSENMFNQWEQRSYSHFKKYFNDLGDEADTEEWKSANLNVDLIENIIRNISED